MSLETTQDITLDFTVPRIKNIRCVENDKNSRIVNIKITNNGELYLLDKNEMMATYKIHKPDHTYIFNQIPINDDGTVTIELSEQAMSVPGISKSELQISDLSSKKVLSTMPFNIIIEKSVLSEKDILSKNESNLLENITNINDHISNKMNPHDVTAGQLNLGMVDNTSDMDKPVSKAQQNALNKKADIDSPTLTGTPKAPTASSGTNTTQIATTAFVQDAISGKADVSVVGANTKQEVTYVTPNDTWGKSEWNNGYSIAYALKDISKKLTDALFGITPEKINAMGFRTVTKNELDSTLIEGIVKVMGNPSDPVIGTNTAESMLTTYIIGSWCDQGGALTQIALDVGGSGGCKKYIRTGNGRGVITWWDWEFYEQNNYGVCETPSSATEKTVDCGYFSLNKGSEVTIRFNNTNTAASPTLNVSSTGAKPIYYHGSAITAGLIAANRTYTFIYNGVQWDFVGDINTDTNTWNANTASSEGYVAKGGGNPNKVWKTDANGNPAWRDEATPTASGVTGVKGNAETSYRSGNVNLTPGNIGAVSTDYLTEHYAVDCMSGKFISFRGVGWKRIAECDANDNADGSCIINIYRYFSNTNNEYHRIHFLNTYMSYEFAPMADKSNTQVITKTRFIKEAGGKCFIEVYYNTSVANSAYVLIEGAPTRGVPWKAVDATANTETPASGTVAATYNIQTNFNASMFVKNDYIAGHYVADYVSQRTYMMNGVGWKKVAEIGQGDVSTGSCVIDIKRQYANMNNEYHRIQFLNTYKKYEFYPIADRTNNQLLLKMRIVVGAGGKCYIEVYYNSALQNPVTVTIENATNPENLNVNSWKVIDPVDDTEIPSSGTVAATYDIRTFFNTGMLAMKDGNNVSGIWGNLTAGAVYGEYTQNGGEQAPGYVANNRIKFNMMRKFKGLTDIAGTYMDCMMMNCYDGNDVPYVTAFGIRKGSGNPRAFIAVGQKGNNNAWSSQTELITTANYQNYLSGGSAESYETGTSSEAGITKLYDSTGNNTDGTMTQKITTEELNKKFDIVNDSSATKLGDIKSAGVYQLNATSDYPSDNNSGRYGVIEIPISNNRMVQLIVNYDENNGKSRMYFRTSSENSTSWDLWESVVTERVSGFRKKVIRALEVFKGVAELQHFSSFDAVAIFRIIRENAYLLGYYGTSNYKHNIIILRLFLSKDDTSIVKDIVVSGTVVDCAFVGDGCSTDIIVNGSNCGYIMANIKQYDSNYSSIELLLANKNASVNALCLNSAYLVLY